MMKSRRGLVYTIVIVLLMLFASGIFRSRLIPSFKFSKKAAAAAMSVTHTVLFQFKAGVKPDDVKAACGRFLALKEKCIHPTAQSTYITSLKGGKDNSPEGLQNGITHGFVAEFASAEDRDYYVKNDPAHQAFVKSIGDLVEKAIVVDFINGEY